MVSIIVVIVLVMPVIMVTVVLAVVVTVVAIVAVLRSGRIFRNLLRKISRYNAVSQLCTNILGIVHCPSF